MCIRDSFFAFELLRPAKRHVFVAELGKKSISAASGETGRRCRGPDGKRAKCSILIHMFVLPLADSLIPPEAQLNFACPGGILVVFPSFGSAPLVVVDIMS